MSLLEKKPIHITIIVTIGLAIYFNALHVPFYFDDYVNIIDVPLIKNLSYFIDLDSAKVFKYHYGGFIQRYFGFLTFALNYQIHGFNVTGYHLGNIAIHLSASLLVYRLVTLTFQTPYFANNRGQKAVETLTGFIALLAALLFVVHPIQTQAVTYLVQRFASFAAMLYLLSLTCYIQARLFQNEPERRTIASLGWFFASLISAILAMKTKEIAFTLPLTILLYEFLFFTVSLKRFFVIVCLAIAALTGSIYTLSSKLAGGSFAEIISHLDRATKVQTAMSRWDYLATQFRVLATYLRLMIFPAGQRLEYDYPVSHSFFEFEVLLSGALLCSLFAAATYCLHLSRRRDQTPDHAYALFRLVAFGIFWFFITISIESSIIPIVDVIFEHRMYLPSAGLFLSLAAGVAFFRSERAVVPGWPRTSVLAGMAVVILALAATTVTRNKLWSNDVDFWRDNARKSPGKARVAHNLGRALENRGDLAAAEEAYRAAASIVGPDQADALTSLGLLHINMGRLDEALAESRSALALESGSGGAHNNTGMIYGMRWQNEEALKEFQLAAHFMPHQAEPHNNMGLLFARQKRYDEALASYGKALSLNPGYELAYTNRGETYLELGRISEARADFQRSLQINPANAKAMARLEQLGASR